MSYNQQRGYDYHAPSAGTPYTYDYADSTANLGQPASQPYSTQFAGAAGGAGSAGYAAPKKGTSKWIKLGIPVLIVVIAAGVVAGILVSKKSDNNNDPKSSSSNGTKGSSNNSSSGASGGTATGSGTSVGDGRFFSTFDAFFQPVYPKDDNPTLFAPPSSGAAGSSSSGGAWPADPFKPASPSPTEVRQDRPRIIAPKYKWDAIPDLIKADPYMKAFEDQIMKNASAYWGLPRVRYFMDGDSGILDISREKKMRIKAYAYAWRRTSDSKWVDAAWKELDHAMGTAADSDWGLQPPDLWYSKHFLDLAEMTAAFAIAYDWMYDGLSEDQKTRVRTAIIEHGLNFLFVPGNWWNGTDIRGNWNCVCNSGLTLGALAILGDDNSGIVERVLATTVPNAKQSCVNAPTSDGTWRESPNYWYFGTTGHSEMTSALMTATGSDHGLLSTNPSLKLTGLFHIYVTGMTSLFNYADHGPNKFSTTANSMLFYGSAFNEPRYTLFQRDRFDATEPWSVFWYDPSVRGAWWNGLALDHFFNDPTTQWVSMRSTWTDNTGTYIGFKSSGLRQYQTHGDLDCGDFVFDAMGERWFGELGSGDYNSKDYFKSEDQNATRWTYYRKMTQGQNTILLGDANQLVDAKPTMDFKSTGDIQTSNPTVTLKDGSTAYAVSDLSSAYANGASVRRGIRFINNRQQALIQDEINSNGQKILWRAHTNATVTANSNSASLVLNGKKLTATILSPQGASFTMTTPAARLSDTGTAIDQENPGVTALMIEMDAPTGAQTITVLLAPGWDDGAQLKTPDAVPLDGWTLTSHP